MTTTFRVDRDGTTATLTLLRAHCLDVSGKHALAEIPNEIGAALTSFLSS